MFPTVRLESLSSILFKKETLKHNFFKGEIWNISCAPKKPNGCLNLKSRRIPQRIKKILNKIVQPK